MPDSAPIRVAARYLRAQEDAAALEAMADHVADLFLDALAEEKFTGKDVAQAFGQAGITAGDINKLLPSAKTAGLAEFGTKLKILGGLVLEGLWHALIHPFLALGKLFVSAQFRKEVKAAFRRALSHEVRSTRHMLSVAGRLARREEVNPQETKAALHQMTDILSKAVLVYFAGPSVAHLFSGGIWKAFVTLLSPIDEIMVILLDRPLRAVAKKLMNADIGLLPSGFYTHFSKSAQQSQTTLD
jgi:hypothetical protein